MIAKEAVSMIKTSCAKIRRMSRNDRTGLREIIGEIYTENRGYIFASVLIILLFSLLHCFGSGAAMASEEAQDTAKTLGGSFGGLLASVMGTGYFAGIDTSWTMVIIAIASLVEKLVKATGLFGLKILSEYTFGIFGSTVVCIVALGWFGVPLVLRFFSKTAPIGDVIEQELKHFNGVLVAIITVSQMFTYSSTSSIANAAGTDASGTSAAQVAGQWFGFVTYFLALAATLIIYFLVKYLSSMIDIIMVPVCAFVPFVSMIYTSAKFVLIWVLLLLAAFMPALFGVIFLAILITSAILFRTAYLACRYFKNIYAKPLFKRIFGGYDSAYPLISKKAPAKIKELVKDEDVKLSIPVYVLRKMYDNQSMYRWDRWWLVSSNEGNSLCKSYLSKKDCERASVNNLEKKRIFINKTVFYYEIFTLAASEDVLLKKMKKIPKEFHIVFSREYLNRYQEIIDITGFTELGSYRETLRKEQPPKEGLLSKMGFKKKEGAPEPVAVPVEEGRQEVRSDGYQG
ncbi:MAG: hypothetical protein K6E90_06735 [Lachnospiraceae bacterium]|nr:hypothetical protein [Lachnospiraceae bacterium]